MRIAQNYFTVAQLAWTYQFAESTIRQWMSAGMFGPPAEFLRVGKDLRVPATGAAFFERAHMNTADAAREQANAIKGRTLGEARRKLAAQQAP